MSDNKTNFANGFDYYCGNCAHFFNMSIGPSVNDIVWHPSEDDIIGSASYCPYCGEDYIVRSIEGLLDYCDDEGLDSVTFYFTFPKDEVIPLSDTGATPNQVISIVGEHKLRRRRNDEVTPEIIAYFTRININIVRKVFEELHITEIGGAK